MSQVGMETSTEGRSWALATNLQGVERAMGHSWWPENWGSMKPTRAALACFRQPQILESTGFGIPASQFKTRLHILKWGCMMKSSQAPKQEIMQSWGSPGNLHKPNMCTHTSQVHRHLSKDTDTCPQVNTHRPTHPHNDTQTPAYTKIHALPIHHSDTYTSHRYNTDTQRYRHQPTGKQTHRETHPHNYKQTPAHTKAYIPHIHTYLSTYGSTFYSQFFSWIS